MFRHRIALILSFVMLLALLTSCSRSNKNSNSNSNSGYLTISNVQDILTSESLQKLTTDSINSRYKTAKNIYYEDFKNIDSIGYLAFSYKNQQSIFYGFTVAKQTGNEWKSSYYEDFPNYTKQPVSFSQFVGTYPGSENLIFHVTAGYINDKKINQVNLFYPNNKINVLQIAADQHVFIDINSSSKDSLTKIQCESADNKTIYQKNM